MKKKHYIKDISDIKYCEENGKMLFSKDNLYSFKFERGCWNEYDVEGNLWMYNASIDPEDVCYYEEEPEEPMQEATEKDIGKLCWFWDDDIKWKDVGELCKVCKYEDEAGNRYEGKRFVFEHCRPLTKEEIKEFMEKAE